MGCAETADPADCRSATRPMTDSQDQARLQFGPFVLDTRTTELMRGDVRVPLPPQPVRILALLASRRPELVTRQEIREAIWTDGVHVDFDRALNFAIKQIREAIGDDPDRPTYIETLRGRGYRFIANVETAPSRSTAPVTAGLTMERARDQTRYGPIAAAALIAVVVIASFALMRGRGAAGGAAAGVRSLAVLPIANLSGNDDRAFLADGLTDEIIGRLSRVRSLRVISRTSAMAYKDVKKTIPTIAQELGVDVIVEGALQETKDTVTLTLTLRNAAERVMWSKTYVRSDDETATLALTVAKDLSAQIGAPIAAAASTDNRRVDPRVYEAYVKGRYFWNRRSSEDAQRAIAEFQRAIDLDAGFAPAYAGLADAYTIIGANGFEKGEAAWRRALAAADRAVALDPNLADGHTSRATVADHYEWDWARAESEYRKALELNPGYATAHHWYGYHLLMVGRAKEAEKEIASALSLDPLSPIINANIGFARYIGRDYDGALAHLASALEMHSAFRLIHSYIGLVHAARGAYPEAIAAFDKAIDTQPTPSDQAVLAHVLARSGDTAKARAILAQLKNPPAGTFVPAFYLALVHIGLGEKDEAFAALDRAFAERVGPLNELNVDPMFDSLRADPRFDALRRRLHMQPPS